MSLLNDTEYDSSWGNKNKGCTESEWKSLAEKILLLKLQLVYFSSLGILKEKFKEKIKLMFKKINSRIT